MTESFLPAPLPWTDICPALGLRDDSDTSATYPTPKHLCYAESPPRPLPLCQQDTTCLSAQYVDCPSWRARGHASDDPGTPYSTGQEPGRPAASGNVSHDPGTPILMAFHLRGLRRISITWSSVRRRRQRIGLTVAAGFCAAAVLLSAGVQIRNRSARAAAGSPRRVPAAAATTPGAPVAAAVAPPASAATPNPVPGPSATPEPAVSSSLASTGSTGSVGQGTLPAAPTATRSAAAGVAPGWVSYTVQPGESLSMVAARYGVTLTTLAGVNQLPIDSWLYAGQRLLVPAPPSAIFP